MTFVDYKHVLWLSILLSAGASSAGAEGLGFDFKDPKGVNAVSFVLDSMLEPIMGVASGVSGEVMFDPANVETISGTIRVDAESLHVPHNMMRQVLYSKKWMNVAEYPLIEFTFKRAKKVASDGDNVFQLQVVGDFTCRGITKEMTVPVEAAYLPGKLGQRMHGGEGDLLVLRSQFAIKRSDFQINPETPAEVVAEQIDLRVSIVGLSPK
ncbi:MAG: YceI family protein [Phycisphaerae bacterium]